MFFLKIKKIFSNKGFTLVEVLTASSIVILVITAAIGIFVSTTTAERGVVRMKTVEDNARYAMETMSREIRMGIAIDSFFSGNCGIDELVFADSAGIIRSYELSVLPGGQQQIIQSIGDTDSPITSPSVNVSKLSFCLNDFSALNVHPRITIVMTVESANDPSSVISFQTTASLRMFKN